MKKITKRVGRASTAAVAMGALMVSGLSTVALAAPSASTIDPNTPGSLTIHKYAGSTWEGATNNGQEIAADDIPEDAVGLAGVTFKVCRVGTPTEVEGLSGDPSGEDGFYPLNVNNPNAWPLITKLNTDINASANHALPSPYIVSDQPDDCRDLVTNESGVASWDGLAQGVYYVTETDVPATVAEKVLPFLVTVPMANNLDSSWIYDVHVYPKNAVTELEKEAVDPGPLGVGSNIEWNIVQEAPKTQNDITSYRLLDKLDSRLTYVPDSSTVSLGDTALEATDYEITTTPQLTMTLTTAGLDKLNASTDREVVWNFKTTVISIGEGVIDNQAVVWVNNPDGTWEDGEPSGETSVNWGAVKINKINTKGGLGLKGAIFQAFGSEAEAKACLLNVVSAKGFLPAGCDNAIVVYRDSAGAEIPGGLDKFTTADDGTVTIPGLSVGIDSDTERDYWLVEIVAPAGYVNDTSAAHKVTVTAGNITTTATTETIENAQVPSTTLPATGGKGTLILVISALAISGVAVGVSLNGRRKNASENI